MNQSTRDVAELTQLCVRREWLDTNLPERLITSGLKKVGQEGALKAITRLDVERDRVIAAASNAHYMFSRDRSASGHYSIEFYANIYLADDA